MLDDKTKTRISDEAERLYPDHEEKNIITQWIYNYNVHQKAKRQAHIAGAETEAERSRGLVEALEEAKSYMQSVDKFMKPINDGLFETCANNFMNFLHKITEALNQYNNR